VPGAVNTKALENISFTINDTTQKTVNSNLRQTPIIYAEKEWQWYLTGNRDATEISKSAAIWKNMMVPGTTEVNSNYGYFWKYNDQLVRVIDLLRVDPNTRRAIVVHYDLNELERYNSDTPCNVVLNFWIKDGRLHLTVFARSIDLVFGFCNDFYIFAKLMLGISDELGIETGTMHWFITNLHIYERHYDL
jgi:thymidylate synthase